MKDTHWTQLLKAHTHTHTHPSASSRAAEHRIAETIDSLCGSLMAVIVADRRFLFESQSSPRSPHAHNPLHLSAPQHISLYLFIFFYIFKVGGNSNGSQRCRSTRARGDCYEQNASSSTETNIDVPFANIVPVPLRTRPQCSVISVGSGKPIDTSKKVHISSAQGRWDNHRTTYTQLCGNRRFWFTYMSRCADPRGVRDVI